MAKSFKYDDRVVMAKGIQKRFIESVQENLDMSIDDIAKKIGVHRRTLADWRREKYLISLPSLNKLSKISGRPVPKEVEIKAPFWYTNLGAKKGWATILKKYGHMPVNEKYRKKKWYEWWENTGRFEDRKIFHSLPFYKAKQSDNLAEFIGIMMGDGGMSKSQICITLHRIDDLEFSKYVVGLIKKLFKVSPSVYYSPKGSVNNIVVSRLGLVRYLNGLGLVIGNKVKQKFDIPYWIKNNDAYLKACIRGLVDTDGCLIRHKYKVNNKYYFYKKLCFTTMSDPLRKTVFESFKKWGFNPRVSQNRDVRLENNKDMKNYFKLINSHNPKHLKKYHNNVKW